MMHTEDCDCSRCHPPPDFYLLPGAENLRWLGHPAKEKKIFEMRLAQETRALRKLVAREATQQQQQQLYLELDQNYSDPITPDQQITAILVDVVSRFRDEKKYFTPQEVQIACFEWVQHRRQNKAPPLALSRLAIGALVESFDSEEVKTSTRRLLKSGEAFELENDPAFHANFEKAYNRLEGEVDKSPSSLLFEFSKHHTARLIDCSQSDEGDGEDEISVDDLPDSAIREIMLRNEKEEKKRYPAIFNKTGGNTVGRVRPPYWPVALATQPSGQRYLSDEHLNNSLPFWREIMTGKSSGSVNYYLKRWPDLEENLEAWRVKERSKLQGLGIQEWPAPYSGPPVNMGDPGAESEVWDIYEQARESKSGGNQRRVPSRSKGVPASRNRGRSNSPGFGHTSPQPGSSADRSTQVPEAQSSINAGKPPPAQADEMKNFMAHIMETFRVSLDDMKKDINDIQKRLRGIEGTRRVSNSNQTDSSDGSESPDLHNSSFSGQGRVAASGSGSSLFTRQPGGSIW